MPVFGHQRRIMNLRRVKFVLRTNSACRILFMNTIPGSMKVPSVDLRAQYATLREEMQKAIHEVLESQGFILGSKVETLEHEIAAYCRTQYAVGVASGTDALLLGLRAVGVSRGEEVITTPFTFFATAGAVHNAGGVPVFVDIDPGTFNIAVDQIEARITPRTRAIVPVHLFGQPADMKTVLDVARKHGLRVIEDAAQSIGSEYQLEGEWRKAGSMGDLGCVSFFPSKNLGGLGDGGMIVTNDTGLAEQLRLLRVHGGRTRYIHEIVGFNSRLDALQAAALSIKLKYLDGWNSARQKHAGAYDRLFSLAGLGSHVQTPCIPANARSVFNQYVVRVKRRDELQKFLSGRGVSTAVYYPVPLHLQPCFEFLRYQEGDFPVSELAAQEVLALPMYAELTDEMQQYVVSQIAEFYRS
jgi:dTDP-4-amino-4,6-dideoxygalactose transaminase